MLADFLSKRKIAELMRRSRDVTRPDQYASIIELGKLPVTDESLACLIEHTRMRHRNSGAALRAISALGMMNDRRATDHLVRLIREEKGRIEDAIEEALGRPSHVSALSELAEMATALCEEDELFRAKCMFDLMSKIDAQVSQSHLEALAPLVMESALRELPEDRPTYGRPTFGESLLSKCQQPSGRAALQTLQDALIQHHRRKVMTSNRFEDIESSLEWLRASTRPAAAEAVTEFLRTLSRVVTKSCSRIVSDDDDPAVQSIHFDMDCSTSELGQPVTLEELAGRDATGPAATDDARQAYEAIKAEREYREKVYPALLDDGKQRDLEDYAHACLTNPAYDAFAVAPSESHERSKPKLNHLALFLQRVPDSAKAAELLRLILAGDRALLWASAREALARRVKAPEWPEEINWKPLAVDLLERTGDPVVDALLIAQIEADWDAHKLSPIWTLLCRRNPAQSVALAERLLLRAIPFTIPANSREWKEESARTLLSSTWLGGEHVNAVLDVVLANTPAALRIAREIHAREKRRHRMPAYLMMCALTGPEVERELSAWVATEDNRRILEVIDQHKGAGFVQRCKAAASPPAPVQSPVIEKKADTARAPATPPVIRPRGKGPSPWINPPVERETSNVPLTRQERGRLGTTPARVVQGLIVVVAAVAAVWGLSFLRAPTPEEVAAGTSENATEALGAGNVDAAIAAARTATRQSGDTQSFEAYGAALAAGGRFKDAAKAYDEVIRERPDDIAVYLGRAQARRAAGDLKGAIEDYRAIVALRPDSSLYRLQLANAERALSTR